MSSEKISWLQNDTESKKKKEPKKFEGTAKLRGRLKKKKE